MAGFKQEVQQCHARSGTGRAPRLHAAGWPGQRNRRSDGHCAVARKPVTLRSARWSRRKRSPICRSTGATISTWRNYRSERPSLPGIGQSGTAGDRAKNGGAFIANGTRSDQNNFILDGIDNNAKIPDLSNNTNVVIQPSVDALGEFKVETNTYSPEYGHSAGAVLSATTKIGHQ